MTTFCNVKMVATDDGTFVVGRDGITNIEPIMNRAMTAVEGFAIIRAGELFRIIKNVARRDAVIVEV